jgi:hypothetical protein
MFIYKEDMEWDWAIAFQRELMGKIQSRRVFLGILGYKWIKIVQSHPSSGSSGYIIGKKE